MDQLIATIEGLGWIGALRRSAFVYAGVNAAHILGIALLVGSIVHVDLRLIGIWRGELWREALADVLPVARLGFALAALTGLLLFGVRAGHYAALWPFQLKMGLIALALVNIVLFHWVFYRRDARNGVMRVSAAMSLGLWIAILAAGRSIAFV